MGNDEAKARRWGAMSTYASLLHDNALQLCYNGQA